ncbi:hypothetical protein Asera_60400 [Actinocatenispora sera]|uniref:Uncharacterized protein n=1 Tax=Actinocatenispora sera TaxID=390989 RepID=A0A810LBI9_9ACTN|nr:hypothetical protein Asera_60400 [Actinocatenispora sera]
MSYVSRPRGAPTYRLRQLIRLCPNGAATNTRPRGPAELSTDRGIRGSRAQARGAGQLVEECDDAAVDSSPSTTCVRVSGGRPPRLDEGMLRINLEDVSGWSIGADLQAGGFATGRADPYVREIM